MKTCVIIQARMSSTRLPRKVMLTLGGKPMLWHVLERVRSIKGIHYVIVATSTDTADDTIARWCEEKGVLCFRGASGDVLKRYHDTAVHYGADIIIRITADCPLIDGEVVTKGLQIFKSKKIDYLSNTVKRTFPRGFDFEIFTFSALKKANKEASEQSEREHVTPYLYASSGKFKIRHFTQPVNKSMYQITVDTPEDFKLIKELIEHYQAHQLSASKITALLDNHPELLKINSHVKRKIIQTQAI